MIDPPVFSADCLASSWRSIQVAPGDETCASIVRSDRVASDRRLRPPASSYARVSTMAPGLASPVISRSEKTRWCVRASTPAIIACRAAQLVVRPTLDKPAQYRLASLVAVKREAGHVWLATQVRHRAVQGLDDVASDAEAAQGRLDAGL